ncbi:MAG: DUF4129 domain-containing protein [Verrucomicrobia bacterium]|nr:DUF4129 domain-containing protein [Verrucomicrobiota bacterium]
MARFLTQTRSGHCEYFATAAALVLRELGIPARYISGYSMQEKRGEEWLVRGRHAHAWTLAWVDGVWREIDLTPASWVEMESARARFWEKLGDGFSAVRLFISKVRYGDGEWKGAIPWLMLLVLAYAGWRVYSGKQWKRNEPSVHAVQRGLFPGQDSEFYRVERSMEEAGLPRRPGETLEQWLRRLGDGDRASAAELQSMLDLHYRLRFDPGGLTPPARARLREQVGAWEAKRTRGKP